MNGLKKQAQLAREKGKPQPIIQSYAQPRTTKAEFLKALVGTGGSRRKIAERLHVTTVTVWNLINRPDWTDIAYAVYQAERERESLLIGDSFDAIEEGITQRLDYGVATNNARWYLGKKLRATFGDDSKMTIDGSLNHRVVQITIPAEIMSQPLEVKKAALELAEREERKAQLVLEDQTEQRKVG